MIKKAVIQAIAKALWSVCVFVWPFHNKLSSFIFQNLSKFVIDLNVRHELNLWPDLDS